MLKIIEELRQIVEYCIMFITLWWSMFFNLSKSRMKLVMHYIDKIRNVYGNRQLSRNLVYWAVTHIKLKTVKNFFVNSINKLILWVWADIYLSTLSTPIIKQRKNYEVPPRFELGSLDSKSRVLTITPWDHMIIILSLFAWISPLKSFSCV